MYILGISCFFHDSSASLLEDGIIVSAVSEERFSRIKHDSSFPEKSIDFCLSNSGITIKDIDYIVFYEKPFLKFERIVFSFFSSWPFGLNLFVKVLNSWLGEKLKVHQKIRKELKFQGKIIFVKHHESHSASSFFSSDFTEAAILNIDGVGEYTTTSIGYGKNNNIKLIKELKYPNSLGLLYSAFTYYLGFEVNDGEYKLMGLAPYGKGKYIDLIKKELIIKNIDGSFYLNNKYFNFTSELSFINSKFEELFGQKARRKEEEIEEFHKDIANSIQSVLEEFIIDLAKQAYDVFPSDNLCLSGGVALNCVANSKILENTEFKNVFVFPAAGDDGASVGAGLFLYYQILKMERVKSFNNMYLGQEFLDEYIDEYLKNLDIKYTKFSDLDLSKYIAHKISENYIIGWFQGKAEFGPRALGNRSILGNAINEDNWKNINLKIKFRESFRPFAPSILLEDFKDNFDFSLDESKYMTFVTKAKNNKFPATTHIDKTSRVQTVSFSDNPKFYNLLKEIKNILNYGILINTSFNLSGEPIVNTPQDAMRVFLIAGIDILVLGNYVIEKKDILYLNNINNEI